ncbi:MAG: o-succinylbenzoate--CoA ligase [Actinomycetota bacterium]
MSVRREVWREAGPVPCPLRQAALRSPKAPAILGPAGTLSYAELDRRVSAAAERLGALKRGTRVAIHMPKDERYFVLLLALLRAGLVACPVSTRLPASAVAPLLEGAACRAIVAGEGLPAAPGVQKLQPESLLRGGEGVGATPSLRADDPATVVFTSGSTGTPKAALHTLANHLYSALGSNENIPLAPGDRWLHTLPLYHVGGLSVVFRCLLAGAAISLPQEGAPLGEEIERSRATHVSVVATQLRRLLREDADTRSLKAVLLGGGPVPVSLVEEAARRGLPVHTSYGLTEMASQVTTTPPGAPVEELRTSGRVLPHRELRIGEDGEILVRGRTLFAGYVEGERLELPLDGEGWFHTRDIGELNDGGRLVVRGRKDNMFVSGGENVQPEEVEEALRRLGGVEEAVVVAVPDEEWGARPVAFVRADGDLSPESLAGQLRRRLPRFMVPDEFHPWPEDAPAGMKPDRRFFRERALRLRGGR